MSEIIKQLTRRDFLKAGGVVAGSFILAACSPKSPENDPVLTGTPTKPLKTEEPTHTPAVKIEATKTPEKSHFIFFSQKDPRWQDIPDSGKGSMRKSGCGIATGAMVTFTDPYKYWGFCTDYYGPNLTLVEEGWSFNFHRPILESLGYKIVRLEGKTVAIKQKIKEFTAKGIPVWVNAAFYGVVEGHNSEAIGINKDGDIIFNDPWYGKGVAVSDKHIKAGKNGSYFWNAIVPPAH